MHGIIYGRRPCVNIELRISNQALLSIEFVVDTGFAGYLTLPTAAVETLDLLYSHTMNAFLADDSEIRVDVYLAAIQWEHELVEVEVLATGRMPPLGAVPVGRAHCLHGVFRRRTRYHSKVGR